MDILPVPSLPHLYQILYDHYGHQHWWPGDTPDEIIIGAILTQSVSWSNVVKALDNLSNAGINTLEDIHRTPAEDLAPLIRSSLYYNQKAKKLKAFAQFFHDRFAFDFKQMFTTPLDDLRRLMLSVKGLGPETVDSILLYAGGLPVFVVDAYTVRLLTRLGYSNDKLSYNQWQGLICSAIPRDIGLYNDFHAQIVFHCKAFCASRPQCGECPLLKFCPYGSEHN
jgi:endonuclease-3 related protein